MIRTAEDVSGFVGDFPNLPLRYRERYVNREILHRIFLERTSDIGLHSDVASGISRFLVTKFEDPKFDLLSILSFVATLRHITQGTNFYKSRSFNYISESSDVESVLRRAGENAAFMVGVFGIDFFTRYSTYSPRRRGNFFKAKIGNGDFYLSAKGGSGAGTFSVDYAIGVNREHNWENNMGELWRTGFDTELLPDGRRELRIIRTGSAVRFDPVKTEKFEDFKRQFRTTPARHLAFLVLNSVSALDVQSVKALSTQGAKILSSLPHRDSAYDYSNFFAKLGFIEDKTRLWMRCGDGQEGPLACSKRERRSIGVLLAAFHEMQDLAGNPFPLKIAA